MQKELLQIFTCSTADINSEEANAPCISSVGCRPGAFNMAMEMTQQL